VLTQSIYRSDNDLLTEEVEIHLDILECCRIVSLLLSLDAQDWAAFVLVDPKFVIYYVDRMALEDQMTTYSGIVSF
jgi:hypothetical protein